MTDLNLASLNHVLRTIRTMMPGDSVIFARRFLDNIGPNAIDQVMQADGFDRQIVVDDDQQSWEVRFRRLSEPLAANDSHRTYVAAGRRDQFTFDGSFWMLKRGDQQ